MTTTAVWEKETSRIRGIPSQISVVAVQNYGISGTLFLQSLLDGHPHVLSTPALYSHDFYHFWEVYRNREATELIGLFMAQHAHWFSSELAVRDHGLHQMGPNKDEGVSIDAEAFRRAMHDIVGGRGQAPPARKIFFLATFLAYASALERSVREPAVVVFPVHSLPARHVEYLLEDFPDAKFVHMVRDPVQNIGSMVKHIIHNRLPANPLECAIAQVACDFTKHWGGGYYVKGDRPFFPEAANHSRAVRLEDLHSKPKETLESLCKWIGIPWDDRLLESTFDGKKWWNRPESPRISGFGTETVRRDRHNDVTSRFDRARLQGIMCRKADVWGYAVPRHVRSLPFRVLLPFLVLLPFRAEQYQAKVHDVRRERSAELIRRTREAVRRPWRLLLDRWEEGLRLGPELARELVVLESERGLRAFFRRAGRKARLYLAASAFVVRERVLELRMAGEEQGDLGQVEKTGSERKEQGIGAVWSLVGRVGLVLRDYVAPRVWLLRGWADSFRPSRPEVQLLETERDASSGRKPGAVYWVTGLSGSGKTTIGKALHERIAAQKSNVVFLDGDSLREALGGNAGYSSEERRDLAMTYARLCRLLSGQGVDVVCATVSMFHEAREWSRANIRNYKEVYIRVPLPELVARDLKGLYRRALSGEVSNVVGVDLPAEEPKSPDIVLENVQGANVSELVDNLCVRLGINENNAGG